MPSLQPGPVGRFSSEDFTGSVKPSERGNLQHPFTNYYNRRLPSLLKYTLFISLTCAQFQLPTNRLSLCHIKSLSYLRSSQTRACEPQGQCRTGRDSLGHQMPFPCNRWQPCHKVNFKLSLRTNCMPCSRSSSQESVPEQHFSHS